MRIGQGFDAHRLVVGRDLILGGVLVPFEMGLHGHSDADVLIHAVMDALLGAAGLGDIGRHFPDTSEEYAGISSIVLLERVLNILHKNGFGIQNIDSTIVAQRPKLATFIPKMVQNITETLHLEEGFVNVKATTTEGMGFTGLGEGIACHAVATVLVTP